jgi:hypothetical protein
MFRGVRRGSSAPMWTEECACPLTCRAIGLRGVKASIIAWRREKGVRYRKPERPKGCFAFSVPDPFFVGAPCGQPELLAVTEH